ncbi:hypothetical protein CTAYLR_008505 [Chrysophaeum taylorii]|uniref:Methyltransferase type 11 domain-containing protein n=1 Tax=Chrysophaeum taylorii TaxID=2483200 RepID=A0AAD7XLW4_9STRA|nr:hypothetical protein CTAYLR_008505 [Chrysophaeum taylorii]
MDDEWAAAAATWNTDPCVITYSKMAISRVEPLLPADKVMDLGCGTGHLARHLAPRARQVVAVDPSPAMLRPLREEGIPNVLVVEGVLDDALATVHADSVDLVVASSVCAFVPNYPALLRRVAKILRAGGRFLQLDWRNEEATLDNHNGGFSDAVVREAMATTPLGLESLDDVRFDMGEGTNAHVIAVLARRRQP